MIELAHILIVDDDPSIRRMFQLLLGDSGYRVSTASSGEEALAYLELVTPDLVLMDLMLPGVSGQEVTERIKANSDKPFIPVILVTARSDQRSKVTALDAGADDFLVKPVEFAELLARVRAMLRLQRSQRSLRAEQRKTELLLHLTRELGTTLDLDQLLTHFLDRLADAVGAIRASIILTAQEQLRLYSSTRNPATIPLEEILRAGIAGWVLRERCPALIIETRDDPRWLAPTMHQQVVRSVAAVPIIREDRALGAITLAHHTPGYFTEEHLDLLKSVAAQSAIALENAELFRLTHIQKEQLERRTEELQRINQVSHYLSELMLPDQLLRLVVHLVHHTFGYPMVSALLREGNDLVVRAAAGVGAEKAQGARTPVGQGVGGLVALHQTPLCIADARQDARFMTNGTEQTVRSALAVPIFAGREVVGVLNSESEQVGAFGDNDIRLLSTIAGQLGVALANARLLDTEQRRVGQLGQVNTLSVAITAQLDPTAHLRIAAASIARIFGVEHCGIAVVDADQRGVLQIATHSARSSAPGDQLHFPLPTQQIITALDLRSPQFIPVIANDERLRPLLPTLERSAIRSLALAPLISAGQQSGMIVIDTTNATDRFGPAELALLETIASLIAQVLENARLYRKVEDERSTLTAVLSGAADPILLIGPQDQLLLANRAAEERLGLNGAATGLTLDSLLVHADLAQALASAHTTQEGISPAREVTLPEGQTFSISIAPVRGGDEQLIGRVAVLQDITAIKELERRERERLRTVVRRYVSPQVADEVLAGGGEFGAPVDREVVVLFADLRGYTALTEGLDARVLVEQVLNRYFTAMTEVLYRHDGTIDKFLGDGLIGVFGIPIAHDDDVERSISAAVDLQRAFAELRRQWRAELGLDIGMGIGIGYGRAVVGNIGSAQRLDYTLIGDVVNTASRLNGLARPDQIIISHRLVDALPPQANLPWLLRPLGPVLLKGKQEPHLIYAVVYEDAAEVG